MHRLPIAFAGLLFLAVACNSTEEVKRDPAASAAKPAATADAKPKASTRPARTPPAPKAAIPAPEDVAAPSDGAEKTASGLSFKVLQKGDGETKPRPQDTVKVHYTGWTKDGKMFDSSVQRGKPTEFQVKGVIKGWTEGLQLMTKGEKRRFWIPADLAYGETPRMGAPAGQLTFDVELLDIVEGPDPPETPKELTAPADAKKTKSGLAYKLLKDGEGEDKKPAASDRVRVHYSGWTKDGELFDSSVERGRPATFPLGGVIPGWTEGLQLMKVGDKMRFWIPADLAYGDTPKRKGAPAGDLVFDVELLAILPSAPGRMR